MSLVLKSVLTVALGCTSAIGQSLMNGSMPFPQAWELPQGVTNAGLLSTLQHRALIEVEEPQCHALERLNDCSYEPHELLSSFIIGMDNDGKWAQILAHCSDSPCVFCVFNSQNLPVRPILELFPFFRHGN